MSSLLLASAIGCSGEQLKALQFRQDTRLTFVSPEPRTLVHLPVKVAWTFDGQEAGSLDGPTFGIFVDRSPIVVGRTLKSLASGDPSCKRDPRCPDASYLADLGVHVTRDHSIDLATLPRVGGVGDEQHIVTIVLLDDDGRRNVESSWYVEFRLRRRG